MMVTQGIGCPDHPASPSRPAWRKDRDFNTEFQGEATDYTEPCFPREAP